MASHTLVTKRKRRLRNKRAGRKRKNRMGRRSTLSADELFKSLGKPVSPTRKRARKTPRKK